MAIAKNLLTIYLFLSGQVVYSQADYSGDHADKVLKASYEKLFSLKQVRYKYMREAKYADENYHNFYSPEVYFDFTDTKSPFGFQFQSNDNNGFVCYNGVHLFILDKKNKTMSLNKKPASGSFENLSPLYNSLITLRTLIPTLLSDTSIAKTITDTLIGSESFHLVKFQLFDKYVGNLGSLYNFSKEYIGDKHKPYLLLINKHTLLPYGFVSLFKDRSNDFIAARFLDIDITPQKPEELSWFYSTYVSEYPTPKPSKELLAEGSILENWSLPYYDGTKTDSLSLNDFKGKIVMLDFWIKSCGPCIASFPKLNELQKEFGTEKFQLLSINAEDDEDDIKFFYKKYKPAYKMVYGGEKLADSYGIPAYPTIILADKTGKVIYAGKNGFDMAEIKKVIKENL